MNNVLYILIMVVIFSSCNSSLRNKRRANRKIEQAKRISPELFTTDTIVYHDTIIVEKFIVDTVSKFILHDTTTVINNDRLVLKYFYDTLRQEIHHEAECKEKIKIVKEEIVVEKFKGLSLIDKIQLNLIPILLCVGLFIYLFKKR